MIPKCVGLLLLGWTALLAQKPSFEVASIKVNASGYAGGTIGVRGDSLFATNVPLRAMLVYAFSPAGEKLLLKAQIVGLPDWADSEHFDILAKPEGTAGTLATPQAKLMLQSLLEDRFQLRAHLETRELPVYHLVLGKRGPKLSEDQTPPDPRQGFISFDASDAPLPRGAMRLVTASSGTTLKGNSITVAKLISLLQGQSDRMIFDKTGLTDIFDVDLQFASSATTAVVAESGPSLFGVLQEAGFKLEPAKEPMEVLVVESVQRPSAN